MPFHEEAPNRAGLLAHPAKHREEGDEVHIPDPAVVEPLERDGSPGGIELRDEARGGAPRRAKQAPDARLDRADVSEGERGRQEPDDLAVVVLAVAVDERQGVRLEVPPIEAAVEAIEAPLQRSALRAAPGREGGGNRHDDRC